MFITNRRTVLSMVNYTAPARRADKILDSIAHYKQERTKTELEQVRSVYLPPKKRS